MITTTRSLWPDTCWAMRPDAIGNMLASLDRVSTLTGEALEAYQATRVESEKRIGARGDVGLLWITGPVVKRASWISQLLGLADYETSRRGLQILLDRPEIKSILLNVDSPGGEANGCDELAQAIYAARAKKNITAFVSGQACSAAYWIASAAERIVVSDLAMLGSIGVTMTATDRRRQDAQRGVENIEFVSSQSPGKRPDVATDAGKAQIQKMVDDLGAVFVAAVAKHRGVSADTVVRKFGGGGIEVGANAVRVGLADELGQLEAVIGRLKQPAAVRPTYASASAVTVPTTAPRPVIAGPTAEEVARVAKAQAEERARTIAASWKRAADTANASLPPSAVRSDH